MARKEKTPPFTMVLRVKTDKPLFIRRRTKKLSIQVKRNKKVHADFWLPSHCYREQSPDHQTIFDEDSFPDHVEPESRWTAWTHTLRRFVAAVLTLA